MENQIVQYHVVLEGKECGPYTFDELRSIPLKRDTLVWYKGMENWNNAENIESLKILFQNIPPPIPTHSSNSSNVIISSPVDVNIRKVKEKETGKKTSNIVASEIIANLKIVCITLIITLLFGAGFYITQKPPTNNFTDSEFVKFPANGWHVDGSAAFRTVPDWECYKLFTNNSKYDNRLYRSQLSGMQSSAQRINDKINENRMQCFRWDMEEKVKLCVIISLIVLILGRYLLLFGKWVYKNSKT